MMKKSKVKYPFAVMNGNDASDTYRFAESCHKTEQAAIKEAERRNAKNPNYHYYAAHWNAARWDRMRPSPNQYEDAVL